MIWELFLEFSRIFAPSRSRSCRSSSVNFFLFAEKFWKFSGTFGGNFVGFFWPHRTKALKFRGTFRSIFRNKFRSSEKKTIRAKFTLQMCHLKKDREQINGDLKRVIWDCSLQSDSGHPFSSPLSNNSRNTVYKWRFANVLGRINGDLSGRHRGIASLVFSHRGSASQRISAARTHIARILHRIASPFPCLARITTHIASLPASRDMGHSDGDLKRVIWDCSLPSGSEHPIFSPLSKNSRNTVYKLPFPKGPGRIKNTTTY